MQIRQQSCERGIFSVQTLPKHVSKTSSSQQNFESEQVKKTFSNSLYYNKKNSIIYRSLALTWKFFEDERKFPLYEKRKKEMRNELGL